MKRKWIKWVSWILLTPILLFVVLMVLLYVPPVQNFLRKQATSYASEATGMQINFAAKIKGYIFIRSSSF